MSLLIPCWPLSRVLFMEILADRITDSFVAQLVWERLFYEPSELSNKTWMAGKNTPLNWSQVFPEAPQIIADRKASVHLTRSIPKEYKQLLKQKLKFAGYRIGELYPRRTRRATAVNWLLAWQIQNQVNIPENGPMPTLINTKNS